MQRQLFRLATTDPLTGVLNRRAFFERGDELCVKAASAAAERGGALSAIMFRRRSFQARQ
jgi:GGDEF domain-containing protein